jgi:predicted metal-dependent hydrolase
MEDGRLLLRVPDGDDAHDALVTWYRREARGVFEQRVAAWSGLFGLTPGKVSIREQRTRWGSCTYRGDLSFNWRLALAPDWVLDSIVVHELCHIDELNHSDRFWALLDRRYPRHEEASDWLKEHGPALRVTRPEPRVLAAPAPIDAQAAATGRVPRRRVAAPDADGEQYSLFS